MSADPARLTAALADRYRIERELGHGGMATVYLAQDLKHDRKVAVKVLRPELAAVIGAERFLAEIKTTANLQHPHILSLFDSGEAGGSVFYVMPYVDGESLRDRLNRDKQLPVDEAVRIASEVADALDYAHQHHVIHRDIKPENILLHGGHAQVADFGIALAVSRSDGGTRMTETGMSLGTPHYMSPEQAMGEREITAKSDVYALGCVLYEMLAGEPPFTGPSAQAIIARVMTEEPRSLTLQRKTIPAYVESAVTVALAKLPADRFASAHEFGEALQGRGGTATRSASMARPAPAAVGWRARLSDPLVLVPSLVAVAALVGVLVLANRRIPGKSDVVRFSVELGKADHISEEPALALSPDGHQLVVPGIRDGKTQLFSRRIDRMDFVPIAGTEGGRRPFFSPDGRWIGFTLSSAAKLMKVPAEGGAAVAMADASWGGGAWSPDGTIVYSLSYKGGLWRLRPESGKAEMMTAPDTAKGELAHWWPQFLPDGRHVLFTNFSTPIERAKIEVVDIKTGARKVVVEGALYGRYVPSGHLLYARGETMLAQRFDLSSLSTSGSAVAVVEDVAMQPSDGVAGYAVSPNGTLAYVPASAFRSETQPVWVDRSGAERPLLTQRGRYYAPSLSPDGRRVALTVDPPAHSSEVWIYETARDALTRLAFGDASDFNPLWSLDGRQVIYTSERPVFDLYRRSADASTKEEPLFASQFDKYAGSISPDGKLLAFSVSALAAGEIWLLPLDGSGPARPFLQNKFSFARPAISPDGHWLAYDSDESGDQDIYLQSFPDPAKARRQASVAGGVDPRWTKGGRELVYRNGDSVLAVTVNPVSGETSRPVMLFTGSYGSPSYSGRSYDVTPDGSRFLMIKQPSELAPRRVSIVLDWLDELKRKVGTAP